LSEIGTPKITDFPKDAYDYTEVKFEPDLRKFGMTELEPDIVCLMQKRVFDLAGVTPSTVSVFFNGKKIPNVKNF
jgi:DNA topoisomerase-2